jgi:outer membrane receptor protein involved in Fe transport
MAPISAPDGAVVTWIFNPTMLFPFLRHGSLPALLTALSVFTVQAQNAPVPPGVARDEAVTLQTFEVTVSREDSYEALNTSGVTGTNRSIRSLPITMNAYTRTFIDELNATDISDMMKFTPNVTYSLDSTGGGTQSPEQFRLRGLTSKEERRRNGFVSLSKSDTFSTERLEVLRGAQALLYGQGVSSGAVNTVTKRAAKGRFGEVRAQYDSHGTHRTVLDYNHSFGGTSLRVAGLTGHQSYWQDNLADEPRGLYIDVMHQLGRHFVLRANHEYIEEDSRTRNGNIAMTIRDNSTRDPRAGRTLDELLYTGGDLSGIVIGGKSVSYENYRSPTTIEIGRRQIGNTTTVALEGSPTAKLSTRLAWNYQTVHIFNNNNNSLGNLVAPTDSNAIDGQWSTQINPLRNRNYWHIWSVQGAGVYKFDLGRAATNQLIVGGEQRMKQQTFIQQRLYQVDAQGNFVPGTDNLGRRFLPSYYVPVQNGYINDLSPQAGYRWADNAAFNSVPATPDNPRGLSGASPFTLRVERQLAGYVNWLGNWFQDRAETMLGVRLDKVTLDNDHEEKNITDKTAKSGLAGVVYNFTPDFGVYANYSKSFAAAGTFMPTVDNEFPQPGEGISTETGFKFDLWRRRISGSLAFFDNKSQNEALALPNAVRNVIDPNGINGRNGGTGATADVRSRGVELVLTAQPVKGWRVYFSLGTNDATITSSYSHAIFYNDQFNVVGDNVKVKQADGSLVDLMVPSVRTNASSARVPLTLTMLRTDPASGYRATLDPVSGRITNAAALLLTTPGVGTGAIGLPIAQHQLGFVAPNGGIYSVFASGDKTTPNAGFTMAGNSTYQFDEGPLKGFSVGGSMQWQRQIRQGYATIGGTRQLYFQPELVRVDARLGYRLKIRRTTWSFQFTMQNLFDEQPIEKTLAENGTLALVNVSQPPRTYLFSASMRF